MVGPTPDSVVPAPLRGLLLEGIHPGAHALLRDAGVDLLVRDDTPAAAELISSLAGMQVIGIRSKSQLTAEVIAAASELAVVGCFCIGTNQVDLEAANRRGIPVFNAPFSNTRSVAELVIAEVIALARRMTERSALMHAGNWQKSARESYEVRGKTLGIVGYGHIGRQVGVLAEALGLKVLFFDIAQQLPMGNNQPVASLEQLLSQADFVTLHVPATAQTRGMIGPEQIRSMKSGSYLLNLSRGDVVQIAALAAALSQRHLAGAAVDVFPVEPNKSGATFESQLRGLPNVILTPHVGGSTEEAQAAIGREVASALARFLTTGATTGAVNFPQVEPPPLGARHRLVNVHQNVPGVLSQINSIISSVQANVGSQVLATDPSVGYLVVDLDQGVSEEVCARVSALPTNIRTRILG